MTYINLKLNSKVRSLTKMAWFLDLQIKKYWVADDYAHYQLKSNLIYTRIVCILMDY